MKAQRSSVEAWSIVALSCHSLQYPSIYPCLCEAVAILLALASEMWAEVMCAFWAGVLRTS